VWIELEAGHGGNDAGVRLTVADNGPGIAPSDVARVFERFYRANKSRSKLYETDGTGLGLSICQAVVNAHGGTITCHSTLGEGTRFDVWLPQRGQQSAPTPGGSTVDSGSRSAEKKLVRAR
jgi:signal transduction histidine kinase